MILRAIGKRFEQWGRRLLAWLGGALLGERSRAVDIDPAAPLRILVLRHDDRVGNLVMTLPLLASLRRRFPAATLTVLGSNRLASLWRRSAAVDRFIGYRKGALGSRAGPLCTPGVLRRERFDVAIDAGNPTDPSLTGALLTRLAGARYTVGVDSRGFGRFYRAPVSLAGRGPHEIDLRGAVLDALPGTVEVCLPELTRASAAAPALAGPYVALHVGARLRSKGLAAAEYAGLGIVAREQGFAALVTWGETDGSLAAAVAAASGGIRAPPLDLVALAGVLGDAAAVISCDTGPMHLGVALGRPTCGVFVSTDPARYGYAESPHLVIDGRGGLPERWEPVARWLAGLHS